MSGEIFRRLILFKNLDIDGKIGSEVIGLCDLYTDKNGKDFLDG